MFAHCVPASMVHPFTDSVSEPPHPTSMNATAKVVAAICTGTLTSRTSPSAALRPRS